MIHVSWRRGLAATAAACCLALLPVTAVATPILITNPSFETPDCDVGCSQPSYESGSFPGWTVSIPGDSGGGVFDPGLYGPTSGAGYAAPDGDQVAWSNGGTLSQVFADTLTAGTTYTLTIQVGRRPDVGFPGYDVSLYAGGVPLAFFDETLFAPGPNSFLTGTLAYTALAGNPNLGQALEIRLQSNGGQTNWDHVQLDATAVPEPGTLLLLGGGLLGLASRRRRS